MEHLTVRLCIIYVDSLRMNTKIHRFASTAHLSPDNSEEKELWEQESLRGAPPMAEQGRSGPKNSVDP